MKKNIKSLILASVIGFSFQSTFAEDLKASLPTLPPLVESQDKGVLVDLVKAISEESGMKISIGVYPFPRAIQNIEEGSADFEMPLLVNPALKSDGLKYRYSTTKIFDVVFVLYTNKNNAEINPSNVGKYKIETDMSTLPLLGIKATANPSVESGLQKVDMGRSDGWIFAMIESDAVLKKLDLKNIKRTEYKRFEAKAILPNGPKGEKADKILTDAIEKLKKSGKYQKIMGPLLSQKFVD